MIRKYQGGFTPLDVLLSVLFLIFAMFGTMLYSTYQRDNQEDMVVSEQLNDYLAKNWSDTLNRYNLASIATTLHRGEGDSLECVGSTLRHCQLVIRDLSSIYKVTGVDSSQRLRTMLYGTKILRGENGAWSAEISSALAKNGREDQVRAVDIILQRFFDQAPDQLGRDECTGHSVSTQSGAHVSGGRVQG